MNLFAFLLSLVTLFAASCSDPQCMPDELRVGTTCRTIGKVLPDGSVAAPHDVEGLDGSLAGDAAKFADGSHLGEAGPSPAARDGNQLASPWPADALLDALPGGPPSFQFRADTVTSRRGSVVALPNRRGSDSLSVTAGTLAAARENPAFNGAPTVAFTGSQELASNLANSAWKFLSDGSGFEAFFIGMRTGNTGGNQVLMTTRGIGNEPGKLLLAPNASVHATSLITDASGGPVVNSTLTGAWALDAPGYINLSYMEGVPQEVLGFAGSTNVASSDSLLAPSPSDPASTLYLGRNGALQPAIMDFAELLIFPRRLHEYERQLVREYIAARYGIAAPVLEGVDRDIMSMQPFSWVRADAYLETGSKVNALLDRARPGHSLAQATTAQQVDKPVANTLFNNQPTLPFSTGYYASTLPAADWKFLHDGTGAEYFYGLNPLTIDNNFRIPMGTTDDGNATGVSSYLRSFGVNAWHGSVCTASGQAVTDYGPIALNVGTPTYIDVAHGVATSPQYQVHLKSTLSSAGAYTTPIDNAPPKRTLALGNNAPLLPAQYLIADVSDVLIFNRVLTPEERGRVQTYFSTRYAITP